MTITDDFSALGLSEQMLTAVKAKGFEVPTSIQALTIPRLLNQTNDIIAQSQTGTGKTAAYGLPILQSITPSRDGVKSIILVPTRELAIQAAEELNSYNQERKLSITAIYGGAAISEQLRRLSKGVDIVVGTPGRVLDHIRRGTLRLEKVHFLVLDEADEMLNMGFVEDVEEIMSHTGEDRRVMLFSATMPERIIRLSKTYMRNTEIVRVENRQLTTDLTEQIYFEVREGDKFDALTRIIDVAPDFYGIIFGRTKVGVDELVTRLLEQGYAAEVLHGDVSQAQREKILKKFKKKAANILVATDVAARGIDVDCLTHVINYSLPQDSESYVHRIGRTGRAGNQGTAITFISPSEFRKFNNLMHDIKVDIKKETLPSPQDIVAMKRLKIKGDMQEIIDNETYSDYADVAQELLSENTPEVALSALLRLAFRNELTQTSYSEIRTFSVDRKGTTRLLLGIGVRDGYSAKKIVDMLKYKCGLRDKHIDDVKLFDSYTFVSVPYSEAEAIVRKLNSINRGKEPFAEIAGEEKGGDATQSDAPKRTYKRKDDSAGYSDAPKRTYTRRDDSAGYSDAPKRTYKRKDDSAGYSDAPKRTYTRKDDSAGYSDAPKRAYTRKDDSAGYTPAAEAPKRAYKRKDDSAGSAPAAEASKRAYTRKEDSAVSTEAPKRAYKRKTDTASTPDFSKTPNEGFDWSAFMKYDEGEKWGRDEKGGPKATKSVRKSTKPPVTAAKRVAAKSRKK